MSWKPSTTPHGFYPYFFLKTFHTSVIM